MDLNELAKRAHQANISWWQDLETGKLYKRNQYELLALVITELSEALEGERKDLMDDKLPHRKMAEVEMADAFIRLLDFAGGLGFFLSEIDSPPLPENKGEAIFNVMSSVIKIGGRNSNGPINFAIAQVRRYCQDYGYDLMGAFEEKMAYNAQRKDHTYEARRAEGGKRF